jgi:hypothetical protein
MQADAAFVSVSIRAQLETYVSRTMMGDVQHKPTRSKILFVLIDGIGDVAVPGLDFKTPLKTATTPTFDAIARMFNSSSVNGYLCFIQVLA